MIRNCLILPFIFFTAFKLKAQTHVINSFSPASGPVGATVIISGAGFNAVADSNKVLFGHLKAQILNATPNSLTVIVPPKATYGYISVITQSWGINIKKYSAVSNLPFDVTFQDDNTIAPNAFNIESIIYDTALSSITYTGDFDGDEKLDFSAGNTKLRNISLDTPAFSLPVNLPSYFPTTPYATHMQGGIMGCGDVNEDGLPDLYTNAFNIANDYSTAYLSMEGHFDSVNIGGGGNFVVYGDVSSPDLNNDGDVSFPDLNNDGVSDFIYKGQSLSNTDGDGLHGTMGSLGDFFYQTAQDYYTFFCADLNGDGYKDVVGGFDYSIYHDSPAIQFIKGGNPNTSYFIDSGNISDIHFAMPSFDRPTSIKGADFNGDGKIDLVISISGQGVRLLINSSTQSTMSFLPSVLLPDVSDITSINDINGDGKPDLIGSGYIAGTGAVGYIYKNTSSGNNISFATGVQCPNGITGDFDADGKVDFLVLNGTKRSVFRHNPVSNRKLCPGANISFINPVNGSAFQWQLNTGSGFNNIAEDAVYSGTNTATLQVSNIPSSYYGYEYRCLVDNNPCGQYKVTFENRWLGTTNDAWEIPANWSCGTIPDANTDVAVNSGTVTVNINTTIRSLSVSSSANVTVAPGVVLTITH